MNMKDMLTIKEFSKLSGIEQTTLRYWDDIGLFSPAKRNPENNYRYYSPEQVISVNFITVLSDLDIPLKTINDLENNRTPDTIVELIQQQERKLDMEMRKIREQYSIMHTRLELINYGRQLQNGFHMVDGVRTPNGEPTDKSTWVDANEITILRRESKNIILGPRTNWSPGQPFFEPFMDFCHAASDLRINLSLPIGSMHESFENFLKRPGEPDYFFSVDPTGNRERPAGKYLVGFTNGYYGQFGDLAGRMQTYALENKLKPTGPVFTLYLLDEVCVPSPDQYLAQVCIAI